MSRNTCLKSDNNGVRINKSSIIKIFLLPTFFWCFLSFLYVLFFGDRYSETNFFNSWDFLAWIMFSGYIIFIGVVSICLHFIIKKYFIGAMAIIIFLFIMATIDFDYELSSLMFITMLTIPIFGSLTLRYLHKKHDQHVE
ncbi:hypothetical protein F6Q07_02850 [Pectobacterium parmentieri]|uniref:Uncharacterized protein n=1 Tax=Pectobacterium parmentieri TaxID=1905730 RepID=A0A8B3FFJ3_PECPM|nr:hypothetical protein Pecwa_4131 [Pectobacterium parmentieri WPP163]AOR61303.1 hypothetical protein A8F97_20835 [Pectobacterium parmentieri]AYH03240.1 hypothetical protein C5E26_21045 [Pectobacterium parmentieri]AYH07569.1 hypothetical protein C5E25_20485 [Pectobacterium parmentieri]AYH12036.1 hypothetical protein C5E24_21205 [Pectobacterium parmentieri]